MDTPDPLIVVIVLSFNRKSKLLACLTSVAELRYSPYEVVVVDNGSSDGSADAVRDAFPQTHLIRNATNLGPPAGRNVGVRFADANRRYRYALFLDDDTLVDPWFLTRLYEALSQDPYAGIACGKAYMSYPSKTIMSAGIETNFYTGVIRDIGSGAIDDGRFDRSMYVDGCGSFGLLIRQQVLSDLGGFDEHFSPYGWEDVDLCLRAQKAGYRCLYVPNALIYHEGSILGRGRIPSYERSKVRNYFYLLWRHTSFLQKLCWPFALTFRASLLASSLIARGQLKVVAAQARGLIDSFLGTR